MTSNIRHAMFQVLQLMTFSDENNVIVDNGDLVLANNGSQCRWYNVVFIG